MSPRWRFTLLWRAADTGTNKFHTIFFSRKQQDVHIIVPSERHKSSALTRKRNWQSSDFSIAWARTFSLIASWLLTPATLCFLLRKHWCQEVRESPWKLLLPSHKWPTSLFVILVGTTFIGQGFYGSIGYSVGAAFGTAVAGTQSPLKLPAVLTSLFPMFSSWQTNLPPGWWRFVPNDMSGSVKHDEIRSQCPSLLDQ